MERTKARELVGQDKDKWNCSPINVVGKTDLTWGIKLTLLSVKVNTELLLWVLTNIEANPSQVKIHSQTSLLTSLPPSGYTQSLQWCSSRCTGLGSMHRVIFDAVVLFFHCFFLLRHFLCSLLESWVCKFFCSSFTRLFSTKLETCFQRNNSRFSIFLFDQDGSKKLQYSIN